MHYWLFKSEPDAFSIDDLQSCPSQQAPWDGVRNFQARNLLRDQIKKGDWGFFYHSSCPTPGIVGLMQITKEGYPDPLALEPHSIYYDPRSSIDRPIWYAVTVRWVKKFSHALTLAEIKAHPVLRDMGVARRGNRLSVMPVLETEGKIIMTLMGTTTSTSS